MSLLDLYYAFIDKECAELMKNNIALKKKNFLSAMDSLDSMNQEDALMSILEGIADSPLFDLAENWVAEQATNAAANIINTATSKITDAVAGPLAAARNAAFSMIASAMLFQQELIFYFAVRAAEQIILDINGPNGMKENLTELRDAVRRLYNALMALAHTGDFYEEYLAKLRKALSYLLTAHKKLERVRTGFVATDKFQDRLYLSVKEDLDAAVKLILPPTPKPDASVRTPMMRPMVGKPPKKTGNAVVDKAASANYAVTKGAANMTDSLLPESLGIQTTSSRQYMALQAMWQIPKLVLEMMKAYDDYALHVLKLNTQITTFRAITAPKVEMFSFFKSYITTVLEKSSSECLSIIEDMALSLNGNRKQYEGIIAGFTPDPRAICARTPVWGIRVHALKVLLEGIDVNSMSRMNDVAELAAIHAEALKELDKLDTLKGNNVILQRTDGQEELGDLEPHILALASQSALALVDKTQFAKNTKGQYKSDTVVMAGRRAMSRIDLSITHCAQITTVMDAYIRKTKPKLKTGALGGALLDLCDQFGLDKMKGALTSGDIGAVFMMSPATATYAGAALTALYGALALMKDSEAKACVSGAINDLKVKERAKQTQMSRTANNAAKEQMKQNDRTCYEMRRKKKETEQCVEGGGASLGTPPTISDKIRNAFTGIMGDSSAGGGVTPASSTPAMTAGEPTTFSSMFSA